MLWGETRLELQAAGALLMMATASWTRPWNPLVMQSDASESGYRVKAALSGHWRR